MPCKTCHGAAGLATCAYCGHTFCSAHRAESGGATACAACVQAESARPRPAGAAGGPREPGSARVAVAEQPAPPPLREPRGDLVPLSWGALAAAPAGIYLWTFLRWLGERHALPGWLTPVGTAAGAAFVLVSVWIIVKSRD